MDHSSEDETTAMVLNEWTTLAQQIASALDPKEQVHQYWEANARPDGRPWLAVRPTTVVPNVYTKSSAGSALVRWGETQVTGSVTWQIGQTGSSVTSGMNSGASSGSTIGGTSTSIPTATGDVVVRVESVLHSQMSGGNEPKTTLLPWQNRIQRILRDTLDWKQLVIAGHDGWAWRACINLVILQDDGGMTNALLLASVAALSTASRPIHLEKQPNGRLGVASDDERQPFVMSRIPFGVTLGYRPSPSSTLENKDSLSLCWLIDPTAQEEMVLDSLVHIVIVEEALWAVDWMGKIHNLEHHLPFLETLAVERAKELGGLLSLENEGT